MSIWHNTPTLDALQDLCRNTLVEHLGIRLIEVGSDFLRGTMPVDARTMQPFGILHGGASVVLAETLGSLAATLCIDTTKQQCVGLEINANHIRPISNGLVTGTARALHRGRTTQIWEIHIQNEQHRLVCVSRLTIAVIDRSEP